MGQKIDENKAPDEVKGKRPMSSRLKRFGKYAGIAAFMFFLIKGMFWLVISGLVLWNVAG